MERCSGVGSSWTGSFKRVEADLAKSATAGRGSYGVKQRPRRGCCGVFEICRRGLGEGGGAVTSGPADVRLGLLRATWPQSQAGAEERKELANELHFTYPCADSQCFGVFIS